MCEGDEARHGSRSPCERPASDELSTSAVISDLWCVEKVEMCRDVQRWSSVVLLAADGGVPERAE
jgi:hypothetical protein